VFAQDTLDVVDALGLGDRSAAAAQSAVRRPLIGIGLSMGASTLLLAELLRPGLFDTLVLLDPIVLPTELLRSEPNRRHPLAVMTQRRRRRFDSMAEVMDSFVAKDKFRTWNKDALQTYIHGLYRPVPNEGNAVQLVHPPEAEAAVYATSTTQRIWPRLHEIRSAIVAVGIGNRSDVYQSESQSQPAPLTDSAQSGRATGLSGRRLLSQFSAVPLTAYHEFPTGHFVSMERPDLVADWILQLLPQRSSPARL
jgi:pimeloyl-ACP methyl ester carboxylesterase